MTDSQNMKEVDVVIKSRNKGYVSDEYLNFYLSSDFSENMSEIQIERLKWSFV